MNKIRKNLVVTIFALLIGMNTVMAGVDCSNLTGNGGLMKWIDDIYTVVKYLALVLTVGLGMLDFFKAITASDEKAIKKSGESFVKRIIAVVALFLLPVLIQFILGVVGIPYCL